jgi:natural product biosynthesis luciferase-like monooxygenase protein
MGGILVKFGLMFFAASEDALAGDKYRLVVESARFGDRHGFSSVWVPERHFTQYGSLYPNPAVLHASLATVTERIALRAGSVVAPLHHPLRIAEEWAVVDNLSGGRVGISFAPGWNPEDFAFFPERYPNRYEHLASTVAAVRRLWRGESVAAQDGLGRETTVRAYPTPVQRELPVWITAASRPESYVRAGEIGANVLTHLLDQGEEELARKIGLYREARAQAGFDAESGIVTVMLHTFVGADAPEVRQLAKKPFCSYIQNNIGLLNGLASSRGQKLDVRTLSPGDLSEFVEFLYDRFAASRGLIGTPETCLPLVQRLESMGATEIACLLDFGPDANLILSNLPNLARLKDLHDASAVSAPPPATSRFDPASIQGRCVEEWPGTAFHEKLRGHGLQIDEQLQCIVRIWRRDGEALGRIHATDAGSGVYTVHPGFLDACSRVAAAALPANLSEDSVYIPAGVRELRVITATPQPAWSHAVLAAGGSSEIQEGDVSVHGLDGSPLFEIRGLRLQRMHSSAAPLHAEPDYQLYRRAWVPLSKTAERGADAGNWLILGDSRGIAGQLEALIRGSGGTCRRANRIPDGSLAERIVYLGGHGLEGLLQAVQSMVRHELRNDARLWIATTGAMPVLDEDAPSVPEAQLWGLGCTIKVEHSELWGGLVDIDPLSGVQEAARELFGAIRDCGSEDLLGIRRGKLHVARLRAEESVSPGAPLALAANGTYVITGGTGGIGTRLAAWLGDHGAGNVVSISRSAPVFRANLASERETSAALAEIRRTMPPIRGVFHLAGTLDDALLHAQDWSRFQRSASGKMDGAWTLHNATLDDPLDYFVMFSSMASLVPMPGQGNYAAANSALDALAWKRRSEGRPALSINWGPWKEIGHAATDYGRLAHAKLAHLGVEALPPEAGFRILDTLMRNGPTQVGVANIDWERFFRFDPAARTSLFLSEVMPTTDRPGGPSELVLRLAEMPASERKQFLLLQLANLVRDELKLKDSQTISPRQGLFDLGLDSILALELKTRLEASLGRPLRATLLFAYPTLDALAGYLLSEVLTLDAPLSMAAAAGEGASLSEDELAALIEEEIARRP